MKRSEARSHFIRAIESDERLELDRAALLIAAEEYPSLDVESYLDRLDAIAAEAHSQFGQINDAPMRVMALAQFLSEELGFNGNAENYYDVRNSFLNEVIDRRRGIPIALSVIYMEIARRLGLRLQGVGMPGHFLIKYAENGEELFLDPFHRGRLLSEAGCRALLDELYKGKLEFQSEFLAALSSRRILARMLQNLKGIYLHQRDFSKTLSVIERGLLLQPESAVELRDRGLVYFAMERYTQSMGDLEEYLRRAPQAEDREVIREKIGQIRQRQARLN